MRSLALVSGRARARAQAQLSDLVQMSARVHVDGRKVAGRIRVAIAGEAAEAGGCLVVCAWSDPGSCAGPCRYRVWGWRWSV